MTTRDYLAAQEVLDRCRSAGIILTASADGLEFDAPPGALDEFLETLREHKPEILELLRADWPAWTLQGTISPEEWDDQRQESPAASRLRHLAARLRIGKPPESPDTRGLPTNESRPCDRCGSEDLTPTPCRLGTRWECFAPTCRIAGDRARTWWLGRTIWIEGKEADA